MDSKLKIVLEYPINCSVAVLFNRLSTASGLSEWFADDVNIHGSEFTFVWDGAEQMAKMLLKKDGKLVRFKWEDDEDDESYFEFNINQDELTGDVSLVITDFQDEDEREETIDLWNSQVADLRRVLGS